MKHKTSRRYRWVDPRRPDGVRLLAPYEQAHPSQFPGRLTGKNPGAPSLFDLDADPGEDNDLLRLHPEIVKRLQGYAQKVQTEISNSKQPQPGTP